MAGSFLTLPGTSCRLRNATVPASLLANAHRPPDNAAPAGAEGLVRVDIDIANRTIAAVVAAGTAPPTDAPVVDLDGAMVWPTFIDVHTHIDKGHIWPRQPNPDGTFDAALNAVDADRRTRWRADDVRSRMDFSLRCAWAHGTSVLRTHIDSASPQHRISWPVFAGMREAWKGRIDLQGVGLVAIEELRNASFLDELIGVVADHGGIMGGVTYMVPDLAGLLDRLFDRAGHAGLDVDLHVDETGDPDARSLRAIADAVKRTGFDGRVVAGHCCSLSVQGDDEAAETIAAVADAGIGVVSLPMCNMYLQDRTPGRTPRWRGVTRLHELAAAGVTTAVASDNTRDPFYAFGDLDMVEVMREAVRIGHIDHPVADAAGFVQTAPAVMVGRPQAATLETGGPADLVVFRARNFSELLSRPQDDRAVIRGGRAIDTTLPDYRELDSLMEA